ncbi:MAG: metallophosphoesterase [Fimbriimonadales bacterium]|nr:metallophosphoesterase [Fimbriimonadales bacterium]
MRIGILSDTHDHLENLRRAVDALNDLQVELVLHAGDYVAPFVVNELARLKCRVQGIFGNNDGERLGLAKRLSEVGQVQVQPLFLQLEGCRIAMVHEPEPVEAFARSGLYDLVVYGHTHQQELRTVDACLVINPGEVCGWLTGKATCAVVALPERTVEIIPLR